MNFKLEHTAFALGLLLGAILFLNLACFSLIWYASTPDKAVDDYDPYQYGQCRLYAFEDQHIEPRTDLAPYTVCRCAVNNDNDVTTACCCVPD